MKTPVACPKCRRGVTLIELLVVISVISVLGSLAYVNYQNAAVSTRETKLESDVGTLNRAVQLYINQGGSFAGDETEEQVLDKLKTVASEESAASLSGSSGSFIDKRIETEWQNAAEASGSGLRARWDADSLQFALSREGEAGVRQFLLNESLSDEDFGSEDRVASLPLAKESSWIWDYEDADPATPTVSGASPDPGEVKRLQPPSFSPGSGDVPLVSFQPTLGVTLNNPNPGGSSQIYYSLGGGNFAAYAGGQIQVQPGQRIVAYAASLDTARWLNSPVRDASFSVIPHELTVEINAPGAVTYAEASGSMLGEELIIPEPITVSVNVDGIHPSFISNASFQVATAMQAAELSTGESPSFSGTFESPELIYSYGDWGDGTELLLRAQAVATSPYFVSSSVSEHIVGINPTVLDPPVVSPEAPYLLPSLVTIFPPTVRPEGARVFYTTDETPPLIGDDGEPTTGTLYVAPFAPAPTNPSRVNAKVFGPSGLGLWFQPSDEMGVAYVQPSYGEGAFVGGAALYGNFVGNLVYASPREGQTMNNITFYGNSYIAKGNLYLPGTPEIYLSWVGESQRWTMARDSMFATQIEGRQFLMNGTEIIPATIPPSPRVVDQGEKLVPTNYRVILHNGTRIEGKIFRQSDTPSLPSVPVPTPKDNNLSIDYGTYRPAPNPVRSTNYANVTLNSGPAVYLAPGNYGRLTANNGTAFILGDPLNPDVEQVYNLEELNLNSGSDIIIVGKVTINLSKGVEINNGSVFGNATNPEYLTVNIYTANPSNPSNFAANSGSSFYGRIVAPDSRVDLNNGSVFSGSVTSQFLQITSSSVAFTLPPVIGI